MKNRILILLTALLTISLVGISCEDFVQEVEPTLDVVEPSVVESEGEVEFFITGVVGRYFRVHDNAVVLAEGLADALEFRGGSADGPVTDATFPTFFDLDIGDLTFDNNSVDGVFDELGRARFLADSLVGVAANIDFTDSELEQRAIFTANFYGGLTRYLYAVYFGLSENRGGGVIDNSAFIPSDEMFALALDKLRTAAANAPTDEDARIANTMIGKIQLIRGNLNDALTALQNGMQPGDQFIAQYSQEDQNAFHNQAGRGRNQLTIADRFAEFVQNEPTEANRLQFEQLPASELSDEDAVVYRQTRYGDPTANIDILSWQENHLMLAELNVRGLATTQDAVTLINEVRNSHVDDDGNPMVNITGPVDLDFIELERDKELYMEGNRLIDQRRFGTFHLGANAWRFLPITQSERNNNPNLDDTQG